MRIKRKATKIKIMKYIILFLFPLFVHGQMDTIFQRNGKILLGTIGTVTELNIFFRNEKGINDRIKLSKVVKYVITKKIPKPPPSLIKDSMAVNAMANYNRDEDLQYMKDCFRRCHKSYSSGVVFSVLGVLAMAGGIYYSANPSNNYNQSQTSTYMIIAGAASSLIGSLVIMDSHKWIGRAGLVDYGVGISIMNKSSKRPKN